jgi:phosphate transport system substrate-binding protein
MLIRGAILAMAMGACGVAAGADAGSTGLEMQKARAEGLQFKGKKSYYPADQWNLTDLPAYAPRERITGTVRIYGSNYITDGNLGDYWAEAFRKFHPDAQVKFDMLTTRTAAPALVFGVADIGVSRRLKLDELQLYQRWANRDPLEVVIATGSYNVTGWNPAFGIVVHKDNPLTKITLDQLDGIFGAERLGGWTGTDWHPEVARGPEKNIRKWGQVGLTGEWANKEIVPYGLNLRYTQASTFSDRVLGGSDKWNEKLRIYANYASKDSGGEGSNMGFGRLKRGLNADLVKDRYGIAYIASPVGANLPPQLKLLEVAEKPGGPYYAYTLDNLRSRKYPLYDEMYAYANVDADGRTDPKVREFLRFVLSREGQDAVMRDGKYLPLTAEVVRRELEKLDRNR